MINLNDFYNDGFGWICKHCERELKQEKPVLHAHSRLMREGESESKTPQFSTLAMARWLDKINSILVCPRCQITESVDLM